jgi:hypothetical protein
MDFGRKGRTGVQAGSITKFTRLHSIEIYALECAM